MYDHKDVPKGKGTAADNVTSPKSAHGYQRGFFLTPNPSLTEGKRIPPSPYKPLSLTHTFLFNSHARLKNVVFLNYPVMT